MTVIIQSGVRAVGTFSVDPYEFSYDGDDDRVWRVLEEGPPETLLVGGQPPADVDVDEDETINVDDDTDAAAAQQRMILRQRLGAIGVQTIPPE